MTDMTEACARRLGWKLTRGAYSDTTDDRIDRWYWVPVSDTLVPIDRRGPGFASRREALEHLEEQVLS